MDAESWLTSELASFGCAACGQAYGEAHIRLIAQRDELFFVDLSCDHCGSQAVAIVTIQIEDDVATLETGELVPAAEATVPASTEAISANDVIDAHALLEGFEGDVHELIARFDGEGD
jgi:transcription elongation factor Elf1